MALIVNTGIDDGQGQSLSTGLLEPKPLITVMGGYRAQTSCWKSIDFAVSISRPSFLFHGHSPLRPVCGICCPQSTFYKTIKPEAWSRFAKFCTTKFINHVLTPYFCLHKSFLMQKRTSLMMHKSFMSKFLVLLLLLFQYWRGSLCNFHFIIVKCDL